MTAHIVVDVIQGQIAMACKECGTTGEFLEDRPGNRVVVGNMVSLHNSAQHWENPLEEFKPAVLANLGSLGNGYHVSAEDFTESHNGAEEGTTPEQAVKIISDNLRIKNIQIKAKTRDLDAAKEAIRCLTIDVKSANARVWDAVDTIDSQTHRIETQETLIEELKATIAELLETPEPMPLCKNPEGHNYVPLDQMFVFCTRCGHSIHYKTKG